MTATNPQMTAIENAPLMREFLAWLAASPRPYVQVMDAWRTSCPRFPIWEDAVDHRFVARERGDDGPAVRITAAGRSFLAGTA